MKHELVLGKPFWVEMKLRKSTEEVGPNSIIHWGKERLELDHQTLPFRVAQAVPLGYASPRVTAKDWIRFVREAVMAGLLGKE